MAKMQIRRGVFETNSSSVHSLTMVSEEEYNKWRDNKDIYVYDGVFYTREEIIKELKTKSWFSGTNWEDEKEVINVLKDEGYKTYDDYWDYNDYETFNRKHTTKNGDVVVAFGYYGHD